MCRGVRGQEVSTYGRARSRCRSGRNLQRQGGSAGLVPRMNAFVNYCIPSELTYFPGTRRCSRDGRRRCLGRNALHRKRLHSATESTTKFRTNSVRRKPERARLIKTRSSRPTTTTRSAPSYLQEDPSESARTRSSLTGRTTVRTVCSVIRLFEVTAYLTLPGTMQRSRT